MEFKYRADEGEQPRPPPPPPPPPPPRHPTTTSSSSSYHYFPEQAIRAGHRIPGLGRDNEYFNPGFGLANQYFRSPFDVHEMIQTEIEKERIREEIVLADIARRRAFLAEVRREMMTDGELLAWRARGVGGGRGRGSAFDGFTSFPMGGGMMGFEPREVPFQQNEGRSLEERIAMSLEKRSGMGARREGLEMVPFQRVSVEPKIKEATPSSSEVDKKKEKIVIMAKPNASLSGAKRKAVPPNEESASEFLSNGVAKKKVKDEWSCALCQVSATSERSLNDHIQGKKHKSKEAALRTQSNGNNIGIGASPKKVVKPAVEVTDNLFSFSELGPKSNVEVLQFNQTGESSLHINSSAELSKENNASISQESDKTDNLMKNKLVGVQKAPKKGQKKKKDLTFLCEMCQVGAYNENVMEEHRKGKKHMTRLQEARAPQIVGIQGMNDADEATKRGDKEDVEDADGTVHQEDEGYQTARNKADVLDC